MLVLEYQADDKPAERMIPFVSAYVDKVDKAAGIWSIGSQIIDKKTPALDCID